MSAAIAPNPNDPQAPLGTPARPWWIGYIRELHLDIPLAVESGGTGKADKLNLSDLGAYKSTSRTSAAAITAQENTIYRLIGSGSRTVTLPSGSAVKTGAEVEVCIESPTITDVTITPAEVENLISQGGAVDYVFTGLGKSVRIVRVGQTQWNVIEPDVSLTAADIAETSALKILTATERTKLAGIAEGANNYTHPATHPQSMIDGLADALAAKAAAADLSTHTGNTSNPHGVTKAQVGLGSVDNTADSAKPVSTAQAAAIAACRPKHQYVYITTASTSIAAERGNTYGVNENSCTLTLPTVTTSGYVDGDEICLVLGITYIRTVSIKSSSYILRGTGMQPLNTPFNISGYGTFITFVKTANVWTMSYPEYELSGKAPLASPALTGTPIAPTAAAGTNTTQLATTAFVQAKASGQLLTSGTMTETSTGSPGMIRYDSGKLYVCVATNTWIFFEKGSWT